MASNQTLLTEADTYGLGAITILHPPGTFALTPASLTSIEAIGQNQDLLHGIGLDWGSGTGCLSITASRIPSVMRVIGLEISEPNIDIFGENVFGEFG